MRLLPFVTLTAIDATVPLSVMGIAFETAAFTVPVTVAAERTLPVPFCPP